MLIQVDALSSLAHIPRVFVCVWLCVYVSPWAMWGAQVVTMVCQSNIYALEMGCDNNWLLMFDGNILLAKTSGVC